MKIVLQRVTKAAVTVDGREVASIARGLVLFLAIAKGDEERELDRLSKKVAEFRVFEDESGRMNCSVKDLKAQVLLVSQFTLAADVSKGKRPSFDSAEKPELAEPMVTGFAEKLRSMGLVVQEGVFGAAMRVTLENDGPVTFVLE